jgi:HD-like signal output (HDOD) protein/CheY-like chemotaxis protein
MRKILFVDDEPKILEGLQRMLRSMRHEWEMEFAEGGQAALDTLASRPFDVVVTDMRMPGVNGAMLLTQIRGLHPQMVRIVLSGHSDQELIMSSVGPAHQYLSKPCDPELLKQTVSRACALRDLLSNTTLTLLVSQMSSLPSLPSIYMQLMKEVESPDPSIKKIGEIISKDSGMTAKILQMVNSAFFGLRRHISNPADAVSLLGLDIVKSLVLSIHIFSQFSQARIPGFSLEDLWEHNMAVGALSKQIGKAEKQEQQVVDDSFTAGLLHECGKLILAARLPEEYAEMLSLVSAEGLPEVEAERKVFGATHPEVGAYLLGLWGLPYSIVEAVAFHHSPRQCAGELFSPLTAVHVADYLENELNPAGAENAVAEALDSVYLERLGLEGRMDSWKVLKEKQNG